MIGKKEMKEVIEEEKIRNSQTATISKSAPSSSRSSFSCEREYKVRDVRDGMKSSRASRFNLLENELGLKSSWRQFSRKALFPEFVIDPNNRWYRAWTVFILLWAMYSSFFTPMEFGFFRGLPEDLFILDIIGQIAFLVDIVLRFFVAYRDSQTYRMVYSRAPIAMRYLKSSFVIDLLGCMPWDLIYKVLILLDKP
ncbi:unnamed protein product [Lathyrus sativus]|nr:unnamed protein product [Lathyrus sativus]